ncbi:MAG TPA: PEGA domain-containing protein [Kofleriaceae bacterium]|nr:PEGA domain-containing protein [Kofleriaceae bacterium]
MEGRVTAEKKTKGMCIATRCTSVDQFVQMFARFVDEESFFVSTHNTRPPGLETSFSVNLADGKPVLRGLCVVMQSWTDSNNVFKTPGVRLGIKRLTASSGPVFERLLVTRTAPQPPPLPGLVKAATTKAAAPSKKEREFDEAKTKAQAPKLPPIPSAKRADTETTKVEGPITKVDAATPEVEDDAPEIETRTPGSDYILPANPLSNVSDASLDGFVDCTLYEETANFFPAEDNYDDPLLTDDIVPPPVLATRRPTTAPVIVLPANPLAPTFAEIDALGAEPPPPAPAPETVVTISSVVGPLPGNSMVGLLPTEPPRVDSVVTRLPDSAITPLPDSAVTTLPTGTSVVSPLPTSTSFVSPLPTGNSVVTPLPAPLPYDAYPPPMQPVIRETPVPAGERIDLAPNSRRKKPPMWVLGGGFGVVAVATLAIVIGAKSSSGSSTPAKPAKQPKPEVVAQADLPKPEQPVDDGADKPADEATPKTGVTEDPDGPPMIGEGPCKLTVATTPAGSTISLDGNALAPSPVTLASTCGKHRIDIAHVRYQTTTKNVTLDEGSPGSLDVSLNRPTHAVSFTTTPPGATIFIDGRRAGTTPSVVNVIGFQRLKIELKKTGFQPQSTTIYSKKPQDAVSLKLKKW